MKVKVKHTKTADGQIVVVIRVTDGGDYPTNEIFIDDEDYPKKEFVLEESIQAFVSEVFTDKEEAKKWTEECLEWLEIKLVDWRNISIPDDFESEF